MTTLAEKIAVMQAAERGEEIEFRTLNGTTTWARISVPAWEWARYDYRVPPKKPEYRLFQYIAPGSAHHHAISVYTRNSPNRTDNILTGAEHHVKLGSGKWITEWLPLPGQE